MFKNLFLKSVLKNDPKSFWFFLLFILLQTFFTFKGIENFPFFNFGMFSGELQTEFTTYEIYSDGESIVHCFTDESYSILKRNIDEYLRMKKKLLTKNDITITIKRRVPESWVPFFEKQLTNKYIEDVRFKKWVVRFTKYQTKRTFEHYTIYKTTFDPKTKYETRELIFKE
jgi:hypothetical protein